MPLVPEQTRAIARVTSVVGGGEKRGTGFLVGADGLVLTAFHVVGDMKTRALDGAPLALRFGDALDAAQWHETTAEVVADRWSADDDWALLRCKNAPPGVEPFTLDGIRTGYVVRWQTYGFPDDANGGGLALAGEVRTLSTALLQIYADEIAAGDGAKVSGLSGAPLLVDGHAVGIILATIADAAGTAQAGAAFVLPIARVVAACPGELHLPSPPPPFVAEVAAKLADVGRPLLLKAAEHVGVAQPASQSADALPERVAEGMLRGGLDVTLSALAKMIVDLDDADARKVLAFACTLWIHHKAVERVAESVLPLKPRTALAINAKNFPTGKTYVHRASYLKLQEHPGWLANLRCIDRETGEAQAGLVEQVREEVCAVIGCAREELEREYREYDHAREPIVVVIPGPPPPPPILKQIHDELPDVRLVLLVGESPPPELRKLHGAQVEYIEPELQRGQEDAAARAQARAERELAKKYSAR